MAPFGLVGSDILINPKTDQTESDIFENPKTKLDRVPENSDPSDTTIKIKSPEFFEEQFILTEKIASSFKN